MRLPPLNALRAFEAAARHGGFIGASEELHVTPGAISRQVKLLEAHLGVQLFHRQAQGVRLTAAGKRLEPVLAGAFATIAREAGRLRSDAGDLRVICPPATSIRWLIPKLADFHMRHPDIRVRLTTDFHADLGFDGVEYDVGFSVANWPGRSRDIEILPLFPSRLTPACAPALLEGPAALRRVEDLARAALIHETPSGAFWSDWADWARTFEAGWLDPSSGDHFPNLDIATKAAVMGAGVVMADRVLCRDELEAGTLVAPFPHMSFTSPLGDICLLSSREKWHEPKVEAFKAWAAAMAAREREALGL